MESFPVDFHEYREMVCKIALVGLRDAEISAIRSQVVVRFAVAAPNIQAVHVELLIHSGVELRLVHEANESRFIEDNGGADGPKIIDAECLQVFDAVDANFRSTHIEVKEFRGGLGHTGDHSGNEGALIITVSAVRSVVVVFVVL